MGRKFVSSDWHGCEVALKVFDFLQPDDKLYFLGDAIDRGPIGFTLLKKLLEDPRVEFIPGNHEEYFMECYPQMADDDWERDWSFRASEWAFSNGGIKTIEEIKEKYSDIEALKLAKQLKTLPKRIVLTLDTHMVFLEHAGFTPAYVTPRHDSLWDRTHFGEDWGHNPNYKNTVVIHGHTPVQYLRFLYGYINMPKMTEKDFEIKEKFLEDDKTLNDIYKPEVLFYCNNHKIDIDMCTIASERVALLDLETLEPIYFDKE